MFKINSQFEYPLPKINVDIEKIVLELSNAIEGYFNIRNSGGGDLCGTIISNTDCLKFSQDEFSQNKIKIIYSVDVTSYSKSDMIQSNVIISSNGGEKVIPVIIKIKSEEIITKENIKISSLKDFLNYSKKYPIEARRIISTNDFLIWIKRIGFEHMDMLEHFVKDSNKERALDNFLVLAKLKRKSYVEIEGSKSILFKINPFSIDIVEGSICLNRVGWGYIDEEIIIKDEKDWILFKNKKITTKDFDEDGKLYIKYSISTRLLKEKYSRQTIFFKGVDLSINVDVIKMSPFKIRLSKQSYNLNDEGFLEIENNTEKDLMFEIYANDNFLKFEGTKYFVSKYAKVPFEIKFTAFQKTQFEFSKKINTKTQIHIKTVIEDNIIKQIKDVIIGSTLV